jgi:hypothetical protein
MINAHRKINLNAESRQTVLGLVARQGFGYHALGNLSIEKSIDIAVNVPQRCFAHLRQEGLDHRQSVARELRRSEAKGANDGSMLAFVHLVAIADFADVDRIG